MTYIAGIRRNDCVFLVADSATTNQGTWPRTGNEQVTTSFGETQIFDSSRAVQESALKIHHLGNIAIAVAGDALQANQFVAHVREQIDRHVIPRQAVAHTAATFAARDDLSCQAIAAIVEQPRPALLSFNIARRTLVQHDEQGFTVQTGSQTLFEAELLASVLGLLDSRLPAEDPAAYLVSAVAWLQSMGVRSPLLNRGIGGAFYGVYADHSGITWQSDVVFGVHHRMTGPTMPVIALVRDNVLVLRSGVDEASRALWSSTSARVTIPEWYARWRSFDDVVMGSNVRFIVLIDSIDWRVAVFELSERGTSKWVHFEKPTSRADMRLQMVVDFAPEVRSSLSQPVPAAKSPLGTRICFAWSPCEGAPRIVSFDVTPTVGA